MEGSIGETGLPVFCDDDGGSGLFDGLADLTRQLSGLRPAGGSGGFCSDSGFQPFDRLRQTRRGCYE